MRSFEDGPTFGKFHSFFLVWGSGECGVAVGMLALCDEPFSKSFGPCGGPYLCGGICTRCTGIASSCTGARPRFEEPLPAMLLEANWIVDAEGVELKGR